MERQIIKFQNIKFYTHPIYSEYSASKKGQILGKYRKRILKGIIFDNGYLHFSLHVNNTQRSIQFHGLFMSVLKVIFQMIKKLIILIIINKIIVLKISNY